MSISVSKTDRSSELLAALKRVANMDVLVGIPQETNEREIKTINNAQLLAIHSAGSPLQNLPARPVVEPAIQAEGNKQQISEQMSIAANLVLQGKPQEAEQQLAQVGLLGQRLSQEWFTDPRNTWEPNSPLTVARKIRGTSEKQKQSGEPLDTPLIDTDQLRKAITYVVRSNKND